MDVINDEVARYLEALVRDHLGHVIYPDPRPPLYDEVDENTRPMFVQILAAGLESDDEVVLARLLKAAVSVEEAEQTAGHQDAAGVIGEFLGLAVDYIMEVGSEEGISFLQDVLEQLMKRNERVENEDEEWSDSDASSVSEDVVGSDIIILVGEDTIPVVFTDILFYFWTQRLDTACHACGRPFQNEPPIRTITIVDNHPAMQVRVFNRHFNCIKTGDIFFVPVSHVWDASIREANHPERQFHHPAAASRLIQTLEALFEGAEDAYDPGVEFWHDYFSVPQWQDSVKDQLLLRLPAIYHLADEILVHMADLPQGYVGLLILGGSTIVSDDPMLNAIGKIPLVRAVCGSGWMSRLWVALEYAQCRAACVMDSGNKISRFQDYDPERANPIVALFARDTFSRIVDGAHTQVLGLFRYARSFARSLSQPGGFLGGIAARDRGVEVRGARDFAAGRLVGGAAAAVQLAAAGAAQPAPRNLCLGEMTELVAIKGCQYSRDRLIALHVLLDGQRVEWPITPADGSTIPRSEGQACAHVWRQALQRGDYSPLLLQPRECVPGSNPAAGPPQQGDYFPSWVVGHVGLHGAEWECGKQQAPPQFPPLFIEETGAIRVNMQLVGQIQQVHYLDVEMSGEVDGVDWTINILEEIARQEGDPLTPEKVVDGLNRLFPFDETHMRLARLTANMVFSFQDLTARDPELEGRMRRLLEEYRDDRERVAQEISEELGLNEHVGQDWGASEVTRLTVSRHLARRHRRRRGANNDPGVPVCRVKCLLCERSTLLRLDLRDTGRIGQYVYRIPMLTYDYSVQNGVGLVLDKEGKITGRMLYGPPTCDCNPLGTVEIF